MLLTALGVWHVLQTEPRIDLRIPATRLGRLDETLSKATGRRITLSPEVREEVMLIAVKGISRQELLAKIASAASAEWKEEADGSLLLRRPPQIEAKQREAWIMDRVAALRPVVDQFVKRAIPTPKPWSETEATMLLTGMREAGGQQEDPDRGKWEAKKLFHDRLIGGRLLARILPIVEMRRVAESMPGDRVILCTQPTTRQVKLALPSSILDSFAQEQRMMVAASRRFQRSPIDLSFTSGGTVYYTEPLAAEPAGVGLIVTGRGRTWDLTVFDKVGATLFTSRTTLPDPPSPSAALDPRLAALTKTKIALSPEGEAFKNCLFGHPSSRPGNWTFDVSTGDLRKALLDPEARDPLSFATSEALFQLVQATKADFVGVIPDAAVSPGATLGDLVRIVGLKMDRDGLHAPPSSFESRFNRLSRKQLASYAKQVDAAGVVNLEAFLCLARAGISYDGINREWARIDIPRGYAMALGSPNTQPTADILAAILLDGLTADQRAWLLGGNALYFRELSPAVQKRFHELMCQTANRRLTEYLDSDRRVMRSNSWICEPTTVWGKSVPPEAKITMTAKPQALTVDLDHPNRMIFQPDILAFELQRLEAGTEAAMGYAKNHRLQSGSSTAYRLTLTFENLYWTGSIQAYELDRTTPAKRLDEFPKAFLEQVAEARKRLGG